MLQLRQIVNNVEVPFYDLVVKGYTYSTQLMAETTLTGDVFISKPKDIITEEEWRYKCFVSYKGEIFRLYKPPIREENNETLMIKYTCVFKPEIEALKGLPFLDLVSDNKVSTGLNSVLFNGNITEFKDRLQANLNRLGGWSVYIHNTADTTLFAQVTLDNSTIYDSLAVIFDTFKLRWTAKGKDIFIGYPSETINKQFSYGKGNGLYSITRTPTDERAISRVRGCGSTKNMPYNYYRDSSRFKNPDGTPKILRYTPNLMPKVFADTFGVTDYYDDTALRALGNIDEVFISFDGADGGEEIYPTIKGATYNGQRIDRLKFVGSIGSDEININGKVAEPEFEVKLNPLGFDLSKCVSQQGELTMSMLNGDCAGCNFKVLRINGKNAQVNKATYFYLDPKQLINEIEIQGTTNLANIILGSYTKLSNPDKVYVQKVPFGDNDYIRNNSSSFNVIFDMITFIKGRNTQQQRILKTLNITIQPNQTLCLTPTYEFIAKTTFEITDLPADNWDIMVSMGITPIEPNDTYDAYINAGFSYSSPFIVEGDITYDDGAVSPIDQDVTLTLQKSTNDFDALLPNATLKPKINDEFVFININLPDTYIISAEQRVETALIDYLNKNNFYRNNFSIDIDRKWIAENKTEANKIVLGNKIRLSELTEDLDITNITITHSDSELLDKYDIQISPTLKRISNTKRR